MPRRPLGRGPVTELVVRAARPADADRIAALLAAEGTPVLGTSDPGITAPVLRDAGRRGGIEAVVLEQAARWSEPR